MEDKCKKYKKQAVWDHSSLHRLSQSLSLFLSLPFSLLLILSITGSVLSWYCSEYLPLLICLSVGSLPLSLSKHGRQHTLSPNDTN